MWPFSSKAGKKISMRQLERLLRGVRILDSQERAYVTGLFRKYSSGGISKFEIEKVVREMRFNRTDNIDKSEAGQIKKKLLDFLN